MLTTERLRQVLDYDCGTGVFRWRIRPANCVHVGDVAGGRTPDGYWAIAISGQKYQAHRLAWLYIFGVWPSAVDHRNGKRTDNKIANLREATNQQNTQNQHSPNRNNRSGFLGVSPFRDRWKASIRANGRQHHLGCFVTPEAASVAYVAAKRELHPFWDEAVQSRE